MARAAGERTRDETAALTARIDALTKALEAVKAEHSMLVEQVTCAENDHGECGLVGGSRWLVWVLAAAGAAVEHTRTWRCAGQSWQPGISMSACHDLMTGLVCSPSPARPPGGQ